MNFHPKKEFECTLKKFLYLIQNEKFEYFCILLIFHLLIFHALFI